jgi:hypothetical protein
MIIIGAGMGGLAAGIYGQLNGYKTRIFEMHNIPGGQCTAWKRHGYTFDVCIHHLFGCSPATRINQLWQELGAMPRELAYTTECVSVASPDGRLFHDYYDPDRLEAHLLDLSPSDAPLIKEYVNAIRVFARKDIWGALMFGSGGEKLKSLWSILPAYRSFRYNMQQYAARFSDPFLRQAFPLLVYSLPDAPFSCTWPVKPMGSTAMSPGRWEAPRNWPVPSKRDTWPWEEKSTTGRESKRL